MAVLSEALELPTQVSMMYWRTHIDQKDKVSKGDKCADRVSKATINLWQSPNLEAPLLIL